ncbi:hypothetical protein PROVRETT_07102 [Providencia rettgeri DSM 1131]|nr:hypothetical protein PROVRETT_07102 [Providencia rettgeri DSM 1131]
MIHEGSAHQAYFPSPGNKGASAIHLWDEDHKCVYSDFIHYQGARVKCSVKMLQTVKVSCILLLSGQCGCCDNESLEGIA